MHSIADNMLAAVAVAVVAGTSRSAVACMADAQREREGVALDGTALADALADAAAAAVVVDMGTARKPARRPVDILAAVVVVVVADDVADVVVVGSGVPAEQRTGDCMRRHSGVVVADAAAAVGAADAAAQADIGSAQWLAPWPVHIHHERE